MQWKKWIGRLACAADGGTPTALPHQESMENACGILETFSKTFLQ